jgi:NAD(P)-dependent dehydrogenase (short-subunit alcohol dehydrogenase family)
VTASSTDGGERRVAFITGAGGGVGAACARRFAPTHRLILTDANADALAATAGALRAEDHDVQAEPGDLTDREVVDGLAQRAAATGPLGVVVHAAGLSPSMADAWRILEVNLFGTINVLDALLAQVKPGSVGVCIASISGWRRGLWRFDSLLRDPLSPDFRRRLSAETGIDGHPGRGYALSKRAVILLAERRAHDWGARGGRLVSVSPALIIDTPMGQLEAHKGASGLLQASSLKRNASSGDIAGACVMLASPDAAYVTGVDLRVDGGSIAGYWHHSDPETAAAWDEPAY